MPNVEGEKINLTEFVARQNLFIEQVNHKQVSTSEPTMLG